MKEITKAIIQVTAAIKNIEKSMDVGTGNSSYKAVSDTLVRNALRPEMQKAGLVIIPTLVVPEIKIDRWDEHDNYTKAMKSKQSVFTQVRTEYKLIHSESGESLTLAGYGQGVDSQDKGAGKATTYALKNVLLDLFLLTKGESEDTDSTHSDSLPVAPKRITKQDIINDDIF